MDVILMQDVETLGEQGAVLNVSDGFARNFLFPRKLAVVANKGSLRDLDSRRDQIQRKAQKRYEEDLAKAKSIESLGILVLEASVGADGKLFGTVTPKELAAIIEHKTGVIVDRRNFLLSSPISRVGSYDLTIRLSPKVSAKMTIEIVAAEEEAVAEGYDPDMMLDEEAI